MAAVPLLLVATGCQPNLWNPTGSMLQARSGHTATLLGDGTVLVVGGKSTTYGAPTASAELFDPATERWVTAGAMAEARSDHTATLLSNGRVLVAGGGMIAPLASAELYDPLSRSWTNTQGMIELRAGHTATLLLDGRVLVAGGNIGSSGPLASAEVYDPSTGEWTGTGAMGQARSGHTATVLPDGTVLIVGGQGSAYGVSISAELYSPATQRWRPAGKAEAWVAHTATLLPDGTVLITGGLTLNYEGHPVSTAAAQVYDPRLGWKATGTMLAARSLHTATLLTDGRVLVAGGSHEQDPLASSELYDPVSGQWTTASQLDEARTGHSATLLPDGAVLVAGGFPAGGGCGMFGACSYPDPLSTAEIFGLAPGARPSATAPSRATPGPLPSASANSSDAEASPWRATSNMTELGYGGRDKHSATLLPDGRLLVAGGLGTIFETPADLYDPTRQSWTTTGNMVVTRSLHTATLLTDGRVLVAGGMREDGISQASAELYDPEAKSWEPTRDMKEARQEHTATLLPDGRVLVAGGYRRDPSGEGWEPLDSAELYEPVNERWAATERMSDARLGATATLLANGRVLVVGGDAFSNFGAGDPLATAELYDPSTGAWVATGNMIEARAWHTATLLADGRVLVVGGRTSGTFLDHPLASAELYDPATGTWTATSRLDRHRSMHTATLLTDGTVLISGGWGGGGALADAELYALGTGQWTAAGQMTDARSGHTATLLTNGTVLVVGGPTADLYIPDR